MTQRYPLVLNGTQIQELQSGDTIYGASKVLQSVQLYQSSTRVSFSGENNVALASTGFRYLNSAKIGGALTKLSATSNILVFAQYSVWVNSTNWHDTYMWCVEAADYRHIGFDPYRMSGPQGNNRTVHTFTQMFTGLGVGTKTFYLAHGTGDSRPNTGVLNYNPASDLALGDTTNASTTSQMIALEIEP